jgi:hypothetical protein
LPVALAITSVMVCCWFDDHGGGSKAHQHQQTACLTREAVELEVESGCGGDREFTARSAASERWTHRPRYRLCEDDLMQLDQLRDTRIHVVQHNDRLPRPCIAAVSNSPQRLEVPLRDRSPSRTQKEIPRFAYVTCPPRCER